MESDPKKTHGIRWEATEADGKWYAELEGCRYEATCEDEARMWCERWNSEAGIDC